MKVLIVDDESEILELLQEMVELMGHEAKTAPDGRKALQLLESEPFDLLITDIFMPNVDGVDLIRNIKDRGKMSVLGMTGALPDDSTAGHIALVNIYGAENILRKPFSLSDLEDKIAQATQSPRSA